jgi:ribose transport system substrate-binding protein
MAIALVVAACGGDGDESASGGESAAEGGKKIAIMWPNASEPFNAQMFQAAKAEAEAQGHELIIGDPGNDLNEQISLIETWITQGVDAIGSVIPAPEPFERVAKQATDSGIPFIALAGELENGTGWVNWDPEQCGELLGKQAAEFINAELGGEAKVLLLTFTAGEWATRRTDKMREILAAEAPKAKIVAEQDGKLQVPVATDVTRTVLQEHPDLNVVLGATDNDGLGAYQAFTSIGREPNDPETFIAGCDGQPRVFSLLSKGSMYRASGSLPLAAIGKALIDVPARVLADGENAKTTELLPFVLLAGDDPAAVEAFWEENWPDSFKRQGPGEESGSSE